MVCFIFNASLHPDLPQTQNHHQWAWVHAGIFYLSMRNLLIVSLHMVSKIIQNWNEIWLIVFHVSFSQWRPFYGIPSILCKVRHLKIHENSVFLGSAWVKSFVCFRMLFSELLVNERETRTKSLCRNYSELVWKHIISV